ncbi:MAG: ABC transporter ATP-binding protein [Fidelibacterota bacterium]
MFSAQDIYVHFEGLVALNDFSLSVDRGEIVALIGPNGSGKTTFFNTISRFVSSERGLITFGGQDITYFSAHQVSELGIARTFQNLELFPYLTVLENVLVGTHGRVSLGQAMKNMVSRAERQRQEFMALEILDFLGISGFEQSSPAGLPFGIQKLVELARALAVKPIFILLDEPAAGMNEQETREIGRIITDIRDELGITVLLVEHDMSLVMDISDRVAVMNSGELLAEGKPEEVKTDLQVLEVFLGAGFENRDHA